MSLAIPTESWEQVLLELAVLLKIGGILEIIDDYQLPPPLSTGDAHGQLCQSFVELTTARGIDMPSQSAAIARALSRLSGMRPVFRDEASKPKVQVRVARLEDERMALRGPAPFPTGPSNVIRASQRKVVNEGLYALREGPRKVVNEGLRWHHAVLLSRESLISRFGTPMRSRQAQQQFGQFEGEPWCHPYDGSTFEVKQYQRVPGTLPLRQRNPNVVRNS